jgi:hypothetical protein
VFRLCREDTHVLLFGVPCVTSCQPVCLHCPSFQPPTPRSPPHPAGLTHLAPHPLGHHGVIGGSVLESLPCQALPEAQRFPARYAAAFQLGKEGGVVGGVNHHGHILMVLGGGTDHGRAANVDVLDGYLCIQGVDLCIGGV